MKKIIPILCLSLILNLILICKVQANEQVAEIEPQEVPTAEVHEVFKAEEEINTTHLGRYTITHYCPCEECCGKSDGITASGTQATEGRTIAAEGFPIGTQLLIDGQVYIVEDRFGKDVGNKIDIFVADHERALQYGKYETEVYLFEIIGGKQ